MNETKYFSVPEAAKILGISRVAVFRKVKSGKIDAIRIGRNYAIPVERLPYVKNKELTEKEEGVMNKTVTETIDEFAETIKELSKNEKNEV